MVAQQHSRPQDWLDGYDAACDVAPVRDHTCDSTRDSCDEDWICSVNPTRVSERAPAHDRISDPAANAESAIDRRGAERFGEHTSQKKTPFAEL